MDPSIALHHQRAGRKRRQNAKRGNSLYSLLNPTVCLKISSALPFLCRLGIEEPTLWKFQPTTQRNSILIPRAARARRETNLSAYSSIMASSSRIPPLSAYERLQAATSVLFYPSSPPTTSITSTSNAHEPAASAATSGGPYDRKARCVRCKSEWPSRWVMETICRGCEKEVIDELKSYAS
jgi:hypothetical protein